MKAIKIRIQKSSRWAAILVATVVAIITSIVVANATQTITTPNAAFVSYSLAAGTSSAAITPVTNRSVLVMGCTTTSGVGTGAGHVSLVHVLGIEIVWSGVESAFSSPSNPPTTGGFSNSTGTHIVWLDGIHEVDIQVASADTIFIHNGATATRTGNVTLIW